MSTVHCLYAQIGSKVKAGPRRESRWQRWGNCQKNHALWRRKTRQIQRHIFCVLSVLQVYPSRKMLVAMCFHHRPNTWKMPDSGMMYWACMYQRLKTKKWITITYVQWMANSGERKRETKNKPLSREGWNSHDIQSILSSQSFLTPLTTFPVSSTICESTHFQNAFRLSATNHAPWITW